MKITKKNRELLTKIGESPSDLVFWTFRYFLGRRTIHTVVFAQNLAESWASLDERVQHLICRELEAAFEADERARTNKYNTGSVAPLGDDSDREAWAKVRAAYKNKNEKN
jgi:hypothetical protein